MKRERKKIVFVNVQIWMESKSLYLLFDFHFLQFPERNLLAKFLHNLTSNILHFDKTIFTLISSLVMDEFFGPIFRRSCFDCYTGLLCWMQMVDENFFSLFESSAALHLTLIRETFNK